jgi:hypothetical protein
MHEGGRASHNGSVLLAALERDWREVIASLHFIIRESNVRVVMCK